jgi:predicted PurR-regulated permease PerM
MKDKINVEISWQTLWRAFFFFVLVLLMFLGRDVLIAVFLAIVISTGLDALVNFFERRGLPRSLGVILVFLLIILFLILFLYTIVPILITEVNSVIVSFNESVKDLGVGPVVNPKILESISNLISSISTSLFSRNAGVSPFDAFSQVLGGLGLAVAVFVSSFYLSLSRDGIERFIRAVLPASSEETAIRIYERSRRQIGRWFQTQIILSLVVGFLVWIALVALRVEHAFLLAVLAALFEIVPYVGPILGGAAAVLVALGTSVPLALYTLFVFLGIQQLENHLLVPILTRRSVGLHPVIVIVALLIGAEVAGFLGVIVAVPAAAVFQEVVEEWSSKKKPRTAAV